jgi:hypothetical protein
MRKQRKQSEMYPLVQEYLSSEVSRREFCHGHQIKVHTFQYWLSKYKQEQIKENHVDKFVPLEVNDSSALLNQVVRISYPSGMIVEFPVL